MSNGILIVDDEIIYHRIVEKVIVRHCPGRQVFHAYNGEEAFSALIRNKNKISFILLDWQMPIMGGEEFLLNLSEAPFDLDLQKIQIVVSSGASRFEEQVRQIAEKKPQLQLRILHKVGTNLSVRLCKFLS